MKQRTLLGSLLSLIFGTVIYLLFRTPSLKVFNWLKLFSIDFLNSDLRKYSISNVGKIPDWFLFSLPDGLWISSYVLLVIFIWNFKINLQSIFWIGAIPTIAIFSEIGQAMQIVQGTFDSIDLIFYLLGLIIPLLLIFKNKTTNSINYE